jgi:hypothetical protein
MYDDDTAILTSLEINSMPALRTYYKSAYSRNILIKLHGE